MTSENKRREKAWFAWVRKLANETFDPIPSDEELKAQRIGQPPYFAGYDQGQADASEPHCPKCGKWMQPTLDGHKCVPCDLNAELNLPIFKEPQPQERREFWIEFTGNPENDKECYKRYVSGTEMNTGLAGHEVIHVREVGAGLIPVEDVISILEQMPHGVYCGDKTETRYPCMKCFFLADFKAKHKGGI